MECDEIMDFDAIRMHLNELKQKLERMKDALKLEEKKNE